MADNRSDNKTSTNSIDAIDESSVLTELERIGARAGRLTASRTSMEHRIAETGRTLNQLLGAGRTIPEIRESPLYNQQVPTLQNQIRGMRNRMNSMDAASTSRAESEASTYISRQFDPSVIGGQARLMQGLSSTQNMAAGMSGMSYDELYTKRESTLAGINSRERRAQGEVSGMFGPNGQVNPEKSAGLGAEFSGVKDLIQELAAVNVAMKKLGESAEEAGKKLSDRIPPSNSALASAYGGMFNAAGGAIREIGVGQRIGQVQNIAGYAGWENQKYDMYKSARGGDVMSQLLLSQTRESEKFGSQLYGAQQTANAAFVAGGAAQTAAGAFQVGEGAYGKLSPGGFAASALGLGANATNETLQGGVNMVQGAAVTATSAADMARGVSAGAADIQGRQAELAARRAILQVSASQLQGFRDFGVGQGVAAQGMGRGGEGFLQRTVTNQNMERMVNNRISPDQFNQMSQFGVQNIGSTFNENQIFAARGLERSGYGPMQENMQRMSTLAAAGSNNPQSGLGAVMEAAFSKGLEGSKVLNMMVENTATMAQSSMGRAAGLDVTGASAQLLAASINTKDPNQEFAVQRAATARELTNNIGTNTSATFSGMMATARISKLTGVGGDEAVLAQKLDDQTLKTLQGMSDPDIKKFLLGKGIDIPNKTTGKQFINTLADARVQTELEGGGAGLATMSAEQRKQLMGDIRGGKSFDQLSKGEQLALGKAGGFAGYATGEEFYKNVGGLYGSKSDPKSGQQVQQAMAGQGGGDMQKTLDDMRTSGFAQLSEAARSATKNFKDAASAVKALGDLVKQLEVPGNEGKFSDAAAKSAGSFGADATKFSNSVNTFSTAVDRLMKAAGSIDNRTDVDPRQLMKYVPSMGGDHKQGPK